MRLRNGAVTALCRVMTSALLLAGLLLSAGGSLRGEVFDDYRAALAAFRSGHYPDAERLFSAIVDRDEHAPETLKSRYFLARAEMKLKEWDAAAKQLRAIYSISPAFYSEWNCDYLLGECRRAMGNE